MNLRRRMENGQLLENAVVITAGVVGAAAIIFTFDAAWAWADDTYFARQYAHDPALKGEHDQDVRNAENDRNHVIGGLGVFGVAFLAIGWGDRRIQALETFNQAWIEYVSPPQATGDDSET